MATYQNAITNQRPIGTYWGLNSIHANTPIFSYRKGGVRHHTRNTDRTPVPNDHLRGIGHTWPPPARRKNVQSLQASSSPPFLDLRLRERRFDPRLFALRLAERFAFLLPPFFADAFLREERLFGAMVLPNHKTYGCVTTASSIYHREGKNNAKTHRNPGSTKAHIFSSKGCEQNPTHATPGHTTHSQNHTERRKQNPNHLLSETSFIEH